VVFDPIYSPYIWWGPGRVDTVKLKWDRKNISGNRNQRGGDCQSVRMSIFRTLKQRGHDPIRTLVDPLATYLTTQNLPPLPETQNPSHS